MMNQVLAYVVALLGIILIFVGIKALRP